MPKSNKKLSLQDFDHLKPDELSLLSQGAKFLFVGTDVNKASQPVQPTLGQEVPTKKPKK